MIPKKSRLPRESFRERGYRSTTNPFFSVKTKNNGLTINRIAVVIGKSVHKRAVRRNFLERQAKAALLRVSNIEKDIILTIFPKANTLTKSEFLEEVKKILKTL